MPKNIDIVKDRSNRDPGDVLDAVQAVAHLVRSRQHQALRGGEQDLTPLEARVLFYFAHHPGDTLGQLAEHSGRDKGQLARMVGGLRERGWLQAQADENDRRLTRFTLAPRAAQRHQAMTKQRKRLADAAGQGLSAAERQQLLALLQRLRANLENES